MEGGRKFRVGDKWKDARGKRSGRKGKGRLENREFEKW